MHGKQVTCHSRFPSCSVETQDNTGTFQIATEVPQVGTGVSQDNSGTS